jgi:glycosyltransferase involved in cell wall biosynthesis
MTRSLAIVTGTTPGLLSDAQILQAALGDAFRCHTYAVDAGNGYLRWQRLGRALRHTVRRDMSPLIFMEEAFRKWMRTARCNVLIPNLEWVYPETQTTIAEVDMRWCKSRDAERRLNERGLHAHYLGFASKDRYDPAVPKNMSRFLHLAGRSHLKGTAAVVDAWRTHPEWPELIVVVAPGIIQPVAAPNVVFRPNTLDDAAVERLMNECGVHLCPSEAEGFGHHIGEGLSCASVVVTTNAPPMNEHFDKDEGLVVEPVSHVPLGWSDRYRVDVAGIEAAVETVLAQSRDERVAMGRRARARYVANRLAFERRARAFAATLL